MTQITLPPNYKPSEKEEYMNEKQLEYFRQRLLTWKAEVMQEIQETLQEFKETPLNASDLNDRASTESDQALEIQTRDRDTKLLKKIDKALEHIDEGTYGYCEETGAPIGLKRLEARPIATLCIEAQEEYEREKKLKNPNGI